MQELIAISVLLLALVIVLVGYNMKSVSPVVVQASTPISGSIEPQIVPIYFPRPIYPFPRMGYPIRQFPPPLRPPIRY
jgi:hypothetical protein